MLKQGSKSKTHSSLRESNLHLQNQAALMSCRIRAVEHRRCADELACTHAGLQDRILLNYTMIWECTWSTQENFCFLLCIEVQQPFTVVFLFPCWDIIKRLNAWAQFCCDMWGSAWCETNILRNVKRKMWGDMAYYNPTVWKSGRTPSACAPPNCAYAWMLLS